MGKWDTMSDEEFGRKYANAVEAGRIADEVEPRAKSARYNARAKRIVVELQDGCSFAFPAHIAQGLQDATADQLFAVEVTAGGRALHWEELDADLTVPGLLAGRFGTKRWMSELGKAGGRVKSEAKAAAVRENGRKGGRPRKSIEHPETEGIKVLEFKRRASSMKTQKALKAARKRQQEQISKS
jgi:hypothetical protein